jgi:WD40 repeat protein
MRREAGIAVVILVAIFSLGAGYLAGNGRPSTVTTTISVQASAAVTRVTTTSTTTTTTTVSLGPPYPASSLETANVTVGDQPRTIGVDENLGQIYVAYWFSDNLTVISDLTHSVVATIGLPASSQNGIAVDYQTHMVYVSVDGGVVVEINGTTDQISGELHAAVGYGALAYDPVTRVLYSSVNSSLVGVDVQTGSVVANVSLGQPADSIAVDPDTNMIAAAGCDSLGLVCNSVAFLVNGTSRTLVQTVDLGGGSYPRVAVNTTHHLFYVSGDTLAAINETNAAVVFNVNPQECGPFDSMAFIPSTNQLAAISLDHNYTFIYDGATGALLDMYSLPNTPQFVAYNVLTNELYVTISSQLVAFHDSAGPGYVDTALVGSGENCPLP